MMKKTMYALAIAFTAIAVNAEAFGGAMKIRKMLSIEELDVDGSGSLSVEEFVAPALDHFDEIDTDGDGVVSTEEFIVRPQERFEELDADDNGVLTEAELQAGRPHRRR